MLRDSYDPMNLFAYIPTLSMQMDPVPRRLGAQHGVTARGPRSSSGGLGRRGGGAGGEKGLYFSYPSSVRELGERV